MEQIKIRAVYFSSTNKEGKPYMDRDRRAYNLVSIYEDAQNGRKLYGREYGTDPVMHAWKKGDVVAIETRQNREGFWNFALGKNAKPQRDKIDNDAEIAGMFITIIQKLDELLGRDKDKTPF